MREEPACTSYRPRHANWPGPLSRSRRQPCRSNWPSVAAVVAPSSRDALSEPGDVLLFASTLLHTGGPLAGLAFTVAALGWRDADAKNAPPR